MDVLEWHLSLTFSNTYLAFKTENLNFHSYMYSAEPACLHTKEGHNDKGLCWGRGLVDTDVIRQNAVLREGPGR